MASASESPSVSPSESPSWSPSVSPSESPSVSPSESPSKSPSASPSKSPSASPSKSPSKSPSASPSKSPSASPSESPSKSPSASPSASPSVGGLQVVSVSLQWRGAYLVKWEGLRSGGGNTGAPFACPNYPIRSFQAEGTWGGATLAIQGSNMVDVEGDNWTFPADGVFSALTTMGLVGTETVFTSDGIKRAHENTYWVRPAITVDGDTTTYLTVWLLCTTER